MKTGKFLTAIGVAAFAILCGCSTTDKNGSGARDGVSIATMIEQELVSAVSEALASERLARKDGKVPVIMLGRIENNTLKRFDNDAIADLIQQMAVDSGRAVIVRLDDLRMPPTANMMIRIDQRSQAVGGNEIQTEYTITLRVSDIATGMPLFTKRNLVAFKHDKSVPMW